jgi:hypothetical protein
MKHFFLALLLAFTLVNAASAQSLVGTYKLVSFTADYDDGSSINFFGKQPNGYIIITPKTLMALLVSENRKAGTTVDEKAALLNSLISYAGPYRVDGTKLTTDVEISWNQSWTGTKQGRTWSIEGNRLILVTDKAPSIRDPSKMAVGRLVWERIE